MNENGQDGIRASNNGKSIFVGSYVPGGSMELKGITATDNGDDGIEIEGSDITLTDAVANHNRYGIYIDDSEEIELENVEANDNDYNGIRVTLSEKIELENVN